jgi:hypothetical protein
VQAADELGPDVPAGVGLSRSFPASERETLRNDAQR